MSDRAVGGAVAVLGAGGHAKVVIAALQAAGETVGGVFADGRSEWGRTVLGFTVAGPLTLAAERGFRRAVLAIGDNEARRHTATLDHQWVTVVHPRAWVHESVAVGPGTTIMAGAVVQPSATLGRHVIINTGASVDHDCRIGDFVHVAPGARLAGAVVVGDGALLGIGCCVVPGVEIGSGAVVGAGAVVVKSVAPGETVTGSPARPVKGSPGCPP